MAETKSIKFQLSIDEASLSRTKSAITEITNQLKALASVIGGISMPSGGSFGGHGGGSLLSGIGVTTQRSNTQQPGSGGGGGSAGNVAGILTAGLVADKNLFKTVAEGSKEALKAMKDGLKQAADEQIRDIQRLKREIDSLSKSYNSINKAGAPELAASDMQAILTKGKQLSVAQSNLSTIQGSQGGGGSMFSGITATGVIGGLAGAGAGAIRTAIEWNAALTNRNIVNSNYENGLPSLNQQSMASRGAAFGGSAMGLWGGDLGLAHGLRSVLKDRTMQSIAGTESSRRSALWAERTNPGFGESASNLTDSALRYAGFGGDNAGNNGTSSAREAEVARKQMALQGGLDAEALSAAATKRDSDPMLAMRYNKYYANSSSVIAGQRAAGIGSDEGWANFSARAAASGSSGAEWAGAAQSAQGIVGRGNRMRGIGFLGKQWGGFGAGAQTFALGQEYGGTGQGLLNAFAGHGGIAGRHGIDAVAASNLAGIVNGQVRGGGIGLDPTEAVQGLGSIIGMGGSIGGQMREASRVGRGLGLQNQDLQGGFDPWHGAINAYAASRAFGNNYDLTSAVGKMSGIEMNQVLRSGKVGTSLSEMGGSIDQIRQYASIRDRGALSSWMDTGQNSADATAARGARAAGGIQAYLSQQTKGLSGKALREAYMTTTRQLGGGLASSLGMSPEDAISYIQAESSANPDFAKLSGGGVGDPTSKKNVSRQGVNDQGQKDLADAQEVLKNGAKDYLADMQVARQGAMALTDIGKELMAGESTLAKSLENLAGYIDGIVSGKRVKFTPTKAGAPKAQRAAQTADAANDFVTSFKK